MDLLNGGAGMDALSRHMIDKACNDALAAIMRRGRQAIVVAVAADGVHATLTHAHSHLTRGHAMAFAQALRDKAAEIETMTFAMGQRAG